MNGFRRARKKKMDTDGKHSSIGKGDYRLEKFPGVKVRVNGSGVSEMRHGSDW